ncbi:MAG TPA: glycosyltransferase family 9 protein [Chitinophagaceae bacterium]|nr:glycosyltransferase family 9 protein [Chitinophagaceae bacterium]
MQKFLIIQTAFIGDVVLATGLIEKLHQHFPKAEIDVLLRKGNESLLTNHPFLHELLVWDKKKNKQKNLLNMLSKVRAKGYDKVINLQRFAATGILTAFSGGKETIGFDKNPFSFLFSKKVNHIIKEGQHEIDRNHELIRSFTDEVPAKPRLYPSPEDFDFTKEFKHLPYVCVAPASVWFTKQFPKEKWISFIDKLPAELKVYLIGAPSDQSMCAQIIAASTHQHLISLAGKLSFLQSAALMKDAVMNYVNDSAPLHFASAVNAPTTAVYCSTVPSFGFGPLSDERFIVEKSEKLYCRPCGLHGYKACPEGHFRCALEIKDQQLLETLHTKTPGKISPASK